MTLNKKLIGHTQYTLPKADIDYLYKLDVLMFMQEHHPDVLATFTKINEYPSGDHSELLSRINKYNDITDDLGLDTLLSHGSDSSLKLIIETFTNPGEKIGIVTPNYPHFTSFVDSSNCDRVDFPVSCPEELDELDLTDVTMLYISSPNLPLGYRVSDTQVSTLCNKWPNVMFIVDEAYHEYSSNKHYTPIRMKINNLLTVRTFSKAFGLAGMRIGYTTGSKENIAMMKLSFNEKSVTDYAINSAIAVLDNVDYYLDCAHEIQRSKKWVRTFLSGVTFPDSMIYDYSVEDGNFFLIFAKDTKYVYDVFKKNGLLIRDKSAEIPGAMRIMLGTDHVQQMVCKLIRAINYETVCKYSKIAVYDLDHTLRPGHLVTTPWHDNAFETLSLHKKVIISTNNKYLDTDNIIPKEYQSAGFSVSTTFTRILYYCNNNGINNIAIICDHETNEFTVFGVNIKLLSVDDITDGQLIDCDALFVTWLKSISDITIIKTCIDADIPVFYTDDSRICDYREYNPDGVGVVTFDLGHLMRGIFGDKVSLCDKVTFNEILSETVDIVVGDSVNSDGALAGALNALFINTVPGYSGVTITPDSVIIDNIKYFDDIHRKLNERID